VQALYQWDWLHAEASFQEAIRLDPGYATGHQWYANHVLMPRARFDEAERELRAALELDPGAVTVAASRGLLLALEGKDEQATQQFQSLLDRDPEFSLAHYFLGQVYDRQGRFDDAAAAFGQALTFGGESPEVIAMLAYSEGRAGRPDDALKEWERLEALGESRYVSPALFGLVEIGLGDFDAALTHLDRALQIRATELAWLKVRWFYDPLRGERRFKEIIQQVGL
jgi:tetratricopeptide (TPR) repeat protein